MFCKKLLTMKLLIYERSGVLEEKELYSFSKLDTFNNCKRAYYYTYICGERGGDNIYSFLGTITHELIEKVI